MSNKIKRRNRIDLCTPAENAIRTAVDEVEKIGAHPTLTDIVNELHAVREKLADYVDAFIKLDYSKISNIQFDGIDHKDAPDYCDAYISSADYDGEDMTEWQLEEINNDHDFVYEQLMYYLH